MKRHLVRFCLMLFLLWTLFPPQAMSHATTGRGAEVKAGSGHQLIWLEHAPGDDHQLTGSGEVWVTPRLQLIAYTSGDEPVPLSYRRDKPSRVYLRYRVLRN